MPTINKLFSLSFFFLLLTVDTINLLVSVLTDKTLLRSHKTVEIKVFLNFLLVDERIHTKAQKLKVSTDTDLEH